MSRILKNALKEGVFIATALDLEMFGDNFRNEAGIVEYPIYVSESNPSQAVWAVSDVRKYKKTNDLHYSRTKKPSLLINIYSSELQNKEFTEEMKGVLHNYYGHFSRDRFEFGEDNSIPIKFRNNKNVNYNSNIGTILRGGIFEIYESWKELDNKQGFDVFIYDSENIPRSLKNLIEGYEVPVNIFGDEKLIRAEFNRHLTKKRAT